MRTSAHTQPNQLYLPLIHRQTFMVFYYKIRGGQCKHTYSQITLDSERDIICYVGRDKYENEHLIKYGWPGDIWFHVEGLSSAHVYFRLKGLDLNLRLPIDGIPPDSLPDNTIEDMFQICKHNSISGSKLASCKMVYTSHANLKKEFDMDTGTVTYHSTKACYYGRCNKDRVRIKELERTKSKDFKVDFYQEFQNNQRKIIERKRRERKNNSNEAMYDPMLEDLKSIKQKSKRQGDAQSGIDAALEGLSLSKIDRSTNATTTLSPMSLDDKTNQPIWMEEEKRRQMEPDKDIVFFCERGYTARQAKEQLERYPSKLKALRQLFLSKYNEETYIENDEEERIATREEEKQVLLAMFGVHDDYADDDDQHKHDVQFASEEDDGNLDSVLPVPSYQAPDRYQSPPPLKMEVFSNLTHYPDEPVILAIRGGGLSEELLGILTDRVKHYVFKKILEERGEPQIFNLLSFVGEQAEILVEEETIRIERDERRRIKEAAEQARAVVTTKAQEGKDGVAATTTSRKTFSSESERRAYAKQVLGVGESDAKQVPGADAVAVAANIKQHYDTGVSDKTLIEDLFG